jgi:2-polyprenyl-6-methoxyphenol hydroxylase-like FAD-dependent oxidoreductase
VDNPARVSDERCDCLVVGGGPAGCALAVLLAGRGLSVVLVDHGRAHYSGPNETLLASSLPMLERTGLAALLRDCALPDPLRHGAIWGSDTLQWRDGEQQGLWLRRGPFDTALRAAATARGVRVVAPARITLGARGEACEFLLQAGQRQYVTPAFIAVATGRASLAPFFTAQNEASGPRTFACTLVGEPGEADRSTAVVEALPEGWIWTHVPPQGPASACVLLDAEQVHEQGLDTLVASALARALGPAQRLRSHRLLHANDATARCRRTEADVLLLGDAAATIDPLASQGVEKALAAADHAAAVLGTALQHSDWWPALRLLHAQWERGLFAAHRATAAAFLAQETRFLDAPFWRRRTIAAPAPTSPPSGPLRCAQNVSIAPVLVRQGDQFAESQGARDALTGDTLSHIGYVPVLPLLRVFAVPRLVGEATTLAGHDPSLFVLPPRAVHAAILELFHRGWLVQAPLTNAGSAAAPR